MLSKDINGALTSYVYNEANQLTAETLEEQTITYIYNQNGDLVEKSSGEQYTYDIQGNLTSIIGNGINQLFTYNGNGNRLSKTVDGETTYFVNDLNQRYEQVAQTYNDDGVIDTYTYGLQRIDSKGQTNETYLYDGRGSVVGAVGNGNDFVSYSYTAYGELMPNSPTPTVFGYNAEATDFKTGMQYLRARYYDTSLGRFFQEDDYRGRHTRPSSMNRYTYTEGNPVAYTDPSGYTTLDDLNSRISSLEAQLSRLRSMSAYTAINEVTKQLNKVKSEKKDYMATVRAQKMQEMYTELLTDHVYNPYHEKYGPEWVSKDVYNCLKDIEEGNNLDFSEAFDELDVLLDCVEEAEVYYNTTARVEAKDEFELNNAGQNWAKYNKLFYDVEKLVEAKNEGRLNLTEKEALVAFADEAIPATDNSNREQAAIMYEAYGMYYNTEVHEGQHNTVWSYAVTRALVEPFAYVDVDSKRLMHTHPNRGYTSTNPNPHFADGKNVDNAPLSGSPGVDIMNNLLSHRWYDLRTTEDFKKSIMDQAIEGMLEYYIKNRTYFGDADVVDILGYDGVYLTSAGGNVYLYEGNGSDDNSHATTDDKLKALNPIYLNLTMQSTWAYSGASDSKGHSWTYAPPK